MEGKKWGVSTFLIYFYGTASFSQSANIYPYWLNGSVTKQIKKNY